MIYLYSIGTVVLVYFSVLFYLIRNAEIEEYQA
jgi:hypothetical protein